MRVLYGYNAKAITAMSDASVDAVVCDAIAVSGSWLRGAFRVLKQGGPIVVLSRPRVAHRLVRVLESTGFKLLDSFAWTHERADIDDSSVIVGKYTTILLGYKSDTADEVDLATLTHHENCVCFSGSERRTSTRFNGSDYDGIWDSERLTVQHQRIRTLMLDGEWRTLSAIETLTGDPQASISAQLRHLRKPRFGAFIVQKQIRGDRASGLYEYRVDTADNWVCDPACPIALHDNERPGVDTAGDAQVYAHPSVPDALVRWLLRLVAALLTSHLRRTTP